MFRSAAESAGGASQQMTHSWLITGPPGSGRSNLAYAFATALISGTPDGDETTRIQVEARSHPDLHVLATEGVIIKRDDVREIVAPLALLAVGRPASRHHRRRCRPHDRADLELPAQGARGAARAHRVDPLRAERGRPHPHDPLAGAHGAPADAERRRGRRAPRATRRRRPRARRAVGPRGAVPHRHGAPARHERGGPAAARRDAAARPRRAVGRDGRR